jgi:hypothetical protein
LFRWLTGWIILVILTNYLTEYWGLEMLLQVGTWKKEECL